MSTESETGWGKGFPSLDGDYYSRIDEFDKQPTSIRIESRTSGAPATVYEFGCDKDLRREYEAEDYEYLGPFSTADFEQLVGLREIVDKALSTAVEAFEAIPQSRDTQAVRMRLYRQIETLRHALGTQEGEKSDV